MLAVSPVWFSKPATVPTYNTVPPPVIGLPGVYVPVGIPNVPTLFQATIILSLSALTEVPKLICEVLNAVAVRACGGRGIIKVLVAGLSAPVGIAPVGVATPVSVMVILPIAICASSVFPTVAVVATSYTTQI